MLSLYYGDEGSVEIEPRVMTMSEEATQQAAERGEAIQTSETFQPRIQSVASNLSYTSSHDSARRARRRFSMANTVKVYNTPNRPNWQPGAEPGIDTNEKVDENADPHLEALYKKCDIVVVDFSSEDIESVEADNNNLLEVLSQKRPHHLPCRWISVNGISWDVIKILGQHFGLHRLAIEDLINVRTRTKVDWYSDHAFIVLTLQKLIQLHPDEEGYPPDTKAHPERDHVAPWTRRHRRQSHANGGGGNNGISYYADNSRGSEGIASGKLQERGQSVRTLHRYESNQNPEYTSFMEQNSALFAEGLVVSVEQVAIFLMADNTVISFFEHSGADVEEPILERLKSSATMLRRSADASLIVQALIDAIVDLSLPVKEAYNSARKELQIDVLTNPSVKVSKSLHIFTEEIDMLQNLFKPIVNLVNSLRDHNSEPLLAATSSAISSSNESHRASHYTSHKSGQQGPKAAGIRRAATSTSVAITPLAHVYLGDVLDHCLTVIQSLDQMDASANNLSSLMFNTIGTNTNNFMMIIALGKFKNKAVWHPFRGPRWIE